MMKPLVLLVVAFGLFLPASGMAADCVLVSVDMPHGGIRLDVDRDGTARLTYGALPEFCKVRDAVFSFEDIRAGLEKRIAGQADPESQGMQCTAHFFYGPGEYTQHYVTDQEYVYGLIARAMDNRVPSQCGENVRRILDGAFAELTARFSGRGPGSE